MTRREGGPFSPRVALAVVVFGALAFLALLWTIGSGIDESDVQTSGPHANGKGLHGFAALAGYLEARGWKVEKAASPAQLDRAGMLILTPTHTADAARIRQTVEAHRFIGPTVIILPKWLAVPLPRRLGPKAGKGFVGLVSAQAPEWQGFHDEITVSVGDMRGPAGQAQWHSGSLSGALPVPSEVMEAKASALVPLVQAGPSLRPVAGYLADGGNYPALRSLIPPDSSWRDEEPAADNGAGRYKDAYPVVFVFEPDLFNNYGLAQRENALLAEQVLLAALDGEEKAVTFDLTLAGLGRTNSILKLAFTPPFLAATLCLILAMAIAIWRAFNRLGPPLVATRPLALGKRALVANAAGLMRRARRLHLVGEPHADAVRERIVRAMALGVHLDRSENEQAIDRALRARSPDSPLFSTAAAQMRAARRPRDLVRAAQLLHRLERTLTR